MEALQSNDPAFLETCHRWLLFHYHCNDCGQSKDTCEYGKVCSYGKSTFTHVRGCIRNECAFPRCDLIKAILRHHQACKDETCQLCSPVCKYHARNKSSKPQPQSPSVGEAPSPISASKQPQPPQPPQSMPLQLRKTVRDNTCRDTDFNRTRSQPLPEQTHQHQPHHVGMLFEARHREQCQLSSSLSCSTWTPDTTAVPTGSGGSSGVCTPANAPSGSQEAVAGLQGLHLEKLPQQQQCATSGNHELAPLQPSLQQPAVLKTSASLQQFESSNNSPSVASSDLSMLPRFVSPQAPPRSGPGCGPIIAGPGTQQQLPQQTTSQLVKDQQAGLIYGTNGLAVLLQTPQQQLQKQSVGAAQALQQPHNASLPHGQQHQQQQLIGLQPQSHLSLAPQAVLAPSPPQQFGVNPQAVAGVAGCLPGPGTAILQVSTSLNLTQPYSTYMHNLHQNLQLASQAAGMSFAMFPHPHYGSPVDQANRAILSQVQQQQPQHQVQFQHSHMQLLQGQLQATGLVVGSLAPVPAGSGLFMAPPAVAGAPNVSHSCGLVAIDNGVGPGGAAPWGTFQLSGPLAQVMQAHQHHQVHSSAANYGNNPTSVLLPPQLAGAT